MDTITSQNMINPKVLRIIRIILAINIFCTTINRCLFSWNQEVSPFMFFTVQSNLICGLYWILGSLFPRIKTNRLSFTVTVYIAITGLVFILLLDYDFLLKIYTKLSSGEITDIVHYFSMVGSIIAHYIIPFVAVADFLLFADTRDLKLSKTVFIYPLCYATFAITIGVITGNYVYPFFDPSYMGGWIYVALISAGILFIVIIINKCLYRLNRLIQMRIEKYYNSLLKEQ